jgi:tetratricopeptide (TPR) repeat protein
LIEDAFGTEHGNVIEHLNDLARCRFNAGNFENALDDYTRLLRLTARFHGSDDGLVDIARHCVERCRKGLSQTIGAWRLQIQMDSMLQQARGIRLVEASHDQDRLRDIARRLMARGRLSSAVRLYEHWIGLRLRDAPPDGDLALVDIREYALVLRRAGELARAAKVLQQVVTMRNRRSAYDGDNTALLNDLSEWQACLSESGQIRSATDTARLVESIGKGRSVDRGAV